MLTGRPERLRTRTSCWLAFNHIKSDLLIMRPDYNYEKDFIIKERELLKLEKNYNIVCAYDDREKNIEMFKRHNIKAVKVHNEF